MHFGIVKYGDSPTSLKVDTWNVIGAGLYSCYDTKQSFSDHYEHGVYSVLPSYLTHGRYNVPYTLRNIMRITKIYARKWSRVAAFAFGVVITFIFMMLSDDTPAVTSKDKSEVIESTETLKQLHNDWLITSYSNYPNQPDKYNFIDSEGIKYSSESLANKGVLLIAKGSCEVEIIKGNENVTVYCI